MSPKKEYYPAVYKLLQQTKDEATRLEAIGALGFYKEAREKLVNISRDANEKEQFREAALEAVFVGDKDNIVKYASSIVSDKSATPHLQIMAVRMTLDAKQSTAYKVKAEQSDEYDQLVKRIAEDNTKDPELKKVALEYMQSVESNQ
jgi:HEAT repeat protein